MKVQTEINDKTRRLTAFLQKVGYYSVKTFRHLQHDDPIYHERDKKKDALLIEAGWSILRISWKKLFNDTQTWLAKAKHFINGAEATVDGHPALTRTFVRLRLPPAPPLYIQEEMSK